MAGPPRGERVVAAIPHGHWIPFRPRPALTRLRESEVLAGYFG